MSKAGRVAALVLGGLVVGAIAGGALAQESKSRPPKNLKKVGDHWTPWDPPQPAEGDYLIQPGDTLWDLAGKWLSDPYLWPQVWEQNRYVLDSHWIYPGDPLKIPGQPTVVPAQSEPPVSDDEPATAGTGTGQDTRPAQPMAPQLVPVADPADLYCSGYIDPEHEVSDTSVVGREMERMHVGQGDVVYLNKGRDQGVTTGTTFGVERATYPVIHPETGEVLGTMVRRLGRARVIAAQAETAIAVLEMTCDDVVDGDELVPWKDMEAPMTTGLPEFQRYAVEPSGGKQGQVVAARDRIRALGTGHIIYTDFGTDSGIQPGDVLTLYRDSEEGVPRRMLGQAVILTVDPTTSMAKITATVREAVVGDRVEARP